MQNKVRIERKKQGSKAKIYLVLKYEKKPFVYFVTSVDNDVWDNEARQVRRIGKYKNSAIRINRMIEGARDYLWDRFLDIRFTPNAKTGQYKFPTQDQLKTELNNHLGKTEKSKRSTQKVKKDLFWLLNNIIDAKGQTRSGYTRLATVLKDYKLHRKKSFSFDHITRQWIIDFTSYLFNVRELSNDYAHKLIKTLREVLKEGWVRELHDNRFYQSKDFMYLKEQGGDDVFLLPEEVERLYKKDLSDFPKLAIYRDKFIVAIFCGGLRYVDVGQISLNSIKAINGTKLFEIIPVKTLKTRKYVYIPVHPYVEKILKRHGGKMDVKISSQKFNTNLKVICRLAKIDSNETLVKSQKGKPVKVTKPKYEFVTSKVARKTFATLSKLAGWADEVIMAITGHSQKKAFEAYVMKATTLQKALIAAKGGLFDSWQNANEFNV